LAGELLKKRREELGLGIREISDSLKISSEYLKSIENDEFEKLPVPVYTIGYIRSYAKYLNADAEPVITHFNSHLSTPQPSTIIPISSSRRQLPVYLYVILLLTAGLLTFAVFVSREEHRSTGELAVAVIPTAPEDRFFPEAGVTEPVLQEAGLAGVTERAEKDSVPVASVVSEANIPQQAERGPAPEKEIPEAAAVVMEHSEHRLGITAYENAWLQIVFDNGNIEEVLLRPGISKVWKFNGSAVLKVGNAGGVTLKFDGEELGIPGNPGQVLKLSFPRS
jgi:cytoskeleton protein RodZ